jgi:hypothetical protein
MWIGYIHILTIVNNIRADHLLFHRCSAKIAYFDFRTQIVFQRSTLKVLVLNGTYVFVAGKCHNILSINYGR